MAREITNNDDIIDSRDVIERIEELEALEADEETAIHEDEVEELARLRALAEQGEQYADDWKYGAVLVRSTYFVDYAKQYADDVISDMRENSWPFNHIDWDEAADDLKIDYTEIDFDGVEYLVR